MEAIPCKICTYFSLHAIKFNCSGANIRVRDEYLVLYLFLVNGRGGLD